MTDAYCLKRVKSKLGFPYQVIEKNDEEILSDIIQNSALKFFSKYYPQDKLIKLEECIRNSSLDSSWELPSDIIDTLISVKSVLGVSGDLSFKLYNNRSVRVFGAGGSVITSEIIIVCKVLHEIDLTSIPINQEDIFIELCTILLAEDLLPIRKEFSRLGSPIGDIEINSETLQSFVDKKAEFIEKNFTNIGKQSKRFPIKFSAPYADGGEY